MKKRISLLAAVLLLTSVFLCACSGTPAVAQKSPYELYTLASEKQAALENVHIKADVEYTMEMAGEIIPMNMTMDVKAVSDTAIEADTVTSMVVDGGEQNIPMKMIFVDNTLYYDMSELLGMKISLPFDGEFEDMMNSVAGGFEFDLTEADFASAVSREEGGGCVITVPLSGSAMSSLTDGMLGNLFSSLGMSDAYSDLAIDDSEYIIGIDENGVMETAEIALTLAMTINGEEMKMSMHMVMNISELDDGYVIAAPADADSYVDGESMGLSSDDLI